MLEASGEAPELPTIRDDLRWLRQAFGPAREWDVFVTEQLHGMSRRFADHAAAVAALGGVAEVARNEANAVAVEVLGSARYTAFRLRVERWIYRLIETDGKIPDGLDRSAAAVSRDLLDRCQKRVRKIGKGLDLDDFDGLHRLRIAIKRLRYALEFLVPVDSAPTRGAYLKSLKQLQTRLGDINDLRSVPARLDRLALPEGLAPPTVKRLLGRRGSSWAGRRPSWTPNAIAWANR